MGEGLYSIILAKNLFDKLLTKREKDVLVKRYEKKLQKEKKKGKE